MALLVLLGLTVGWLRPLFPRLLTADGLILALAAIVPITVLMLLVRRLDPTDVEPLRLIVWTFLVGAALAVLAAMVNEQFSYLPAVVLFVLVVGPGEELVKLAATYLGAYRQPAFDHAVDGIFYGVAAGAGFAAIENVTFILNAPAHEAWTRVAVRTTISTPAHAIWAGFAGYYLGLAKFIPEHRITLIVKGLLIAATAHGLFDVLVSSEQLWGVVVAVLMNVFLLAMLVNRGLAHRAYHRARAGPTDEGERSPAS